MASSHVSGNLTVGKFSDFKMSASGNLHAYKIPTSTSGRYLIIHEGAYEISQDGSQTVTFLFPYSDSNYGASVNGFGNDGEYTNGVYIDSASTTSCKIHLRSKKQWTKFIIIGFGA